MIQISYETSLFLCQEETAKAENKPEEKIEEQTDEKAKEKKEEEKAPPPPPPVVLYVDMHCVGCAKKMERCLLKCKGLSHLQSYSV